MAFGEVWLYLLDGFRLERDGVEQPVPPSGQRLLALLGLRTAVSREEAAGILWSELPEAKAQASLRTLLWRSARCYPSVVATTARRVALHPGVRVDVRSWTQSAGSMLTNPGQLEPPAGEPHSGELLPGWYDDWVLVERERLRQLHLHVLEARAARLLEATRFAAALDLALVALRIDPLRESAHRLVIRVHLAEGNISEARRQFGMCRRILADEVGVAPSAELTGLMASARAAMRAVDSTVA